MIFTLMLRSVDQATMESGLLKRGVFIMAEDGPVPRRGMESSPEIPIWTTQPTFDEGGNMTDPGVRDPRYHMNLLVGPPATEIRDENGNLAFNSILMLWATEGVPGEANKHEVSWLFDGIEVIAVSTVNTRSHGFS